MKIFIADDDGLTRRTLRAGLEGDHDIVEAADGEAAWRELQGPNPPALAVLDWMMPAPDGLEIVRRLTHPRPYVILLTAKRQSEDIVAMLEAGADDYVVKPFSLAELRARIGVGLRMVALNRALADRLAELETALASVKQLRGLLPVCAWCRRVRNDDNYWQRIDAYLTEHTGVRVTHGICPDCANEQLTPAPHEAGRDP